MHPSVVVVTDRKRKCGWRKELCLYLRSDGPAVPCCKLPFPIPKCPTCGYTFWTRNWKWVDTDTLFGRSQCVSTTGQKFCPLATGVGRAGLVWVGGKFYSLPSIFDAEAEEQGISRKIKAVPHGFEIGKTWVLLGHLSGILKSNPTAEEIQAEDLYTPAIFRVFCPTRIEYILRGDETDGEIEKLVKRGLTPVIVQRESEPVRSGFEMARIGEPEDTLR